MSDDTREQSVNAYFDGLAAKDMSRVPWAKDATLRTPLNPAGGESALILGRKAMQLIVSVANYKITQQSAFGIRLDNGSARDSN